MSRLLSVWLLAVHIISLGGGPVYISVRHTSLPAAVTTLCAYYVCDQQELAVCVACVDTVTNTPSLATKMPRCASIVCLDQSIFNVVSLCCVNHVFFDQLQLVQNIVYR